MFYKLHIYHLVSFAKKEIVPVIICIINTCVHIYLAKVTNKLKKQNLQ
jgi:hypothetical protein